MKTIAKLSAATAVLAVMLSGHPLMAQDEKHPEKSYKIKIVRMEDGKETTIDTSFSSHEALQAFLEKDGIQMEALPKLPELPELPELPDVPEIHIEQLSSDMSPEEKAAFEKEMKQMQIEMEEARKEMKGAKKEMEKARKEMKQLNIETEELNGMRRIIITEPGSTSGSAEKQLFFKDDGEEVIVTGGPCKMMKLEGTTGDSCRVIVIRKSLSLPEEAEKARPSEQRSETKVAETEAAETAKTPSKADPAGYEMNVKDLKIYPNPSDGRISLSGVFEDPSPVTVRIVDSRGSAVLETTIHPGTGLSTHEFDLQGNARGTYLIQLRQGDKWMHRKVAIK